MKSDLSNAKEGDRINAEEWLFVGEPTSWSAPIGSWLNQK